MSFGMLLCTGKNIMKLLQIIILGRIVLKHTHLHMVAELTRY